MALEQKLALKMSQKLIMTPSLQQAIKLLQLTKLELLEEVSQELVENPVLEESSEITVTEREVKDQSKAEDQSKNFLNYDLPTVPEDIHEPQFED